MPRLRFSDLRCARGDAVKIVPTWADALNHPEKSFEVFVGDYVNLAPHCDLWMRGAKTAFVVRITNGGLLRVKPIVDGERLRRTFTIQQHHVLAPLEGGNPLAVKRY